MTHKKSAINMTDRPGNPTVVLVTGSLEAGGAERALSDMANYWNAKGWRVTVVTMAGPESRDFYSLAPGVNREWLDSDRNADRIFARARSLVTRLTKLRRLLKLSQPDAVLSFIDVPNVMTILAAWGLDLRLVVSERGCQYRATGDANEPWLYTLSAHWRILRKLLYSQADAVTALNADTAKWIEKECRTAVEVIPNGIRELPISDIERESIVLGVGRLKREKGFDILLQAFAAVLPQFPGWRLVIAGDGRNKAELVDLRNRLKMADSVEFLGLVSDVELWMARAGLVVAPSRSEAFGNVILESMAMGAPVLSTICSGPASIIDDGVNGVLVPIEDVDALAAAMTELMSKPDLRRRLGNEATKVRERFQQDRLMAMWERCLVPEHGRPQYASEFGKGNRL